MPFSKVSVEAVLVSRAGRGLYQFYRGRENSCRGHLFSPSR